MGKVIAAEEFLATPLEVIECRVYRGPHLYSHTPMIRIQANLGALEDWPTNHLPHFVQELLALLPGLAEHTCSSGKPGGFVERLKDGTWMGHVIEHVAIELQTMAGIRVTRGKTRSIKGKPGCYNIMYSYVYEDAGLCAGRLALDLVASLLQAPFVPFQNVHKVHAFECANGFALDEALAELKRLVKKQKLGPTAQALVDEAERRHIPWFRLDEQSLIQLGTGRYRKLIRASITSATSSIAVDTACDKELTKKLLSGAGIPVPMGDVVRTAQGAAEAAAEIGFPVVIKPLDGNHGRGVATDLKNAEEVIEAFPRAKAHSRSVIVERYFTGQDYRVLVIDGEIAAVAERQPAHVIGNGIDTIANLIAKVNEDPRRGDGHEDVMTRIVINDAMIQWMARSQLTLESVPPLMQRVVLSPTANLSTGATATDRTDEIHPDNAAIARRAALAVGLDIAGIDMILPDITRSWRETGGGIVEVNAAPGFRMHLHPSEGQARNVARNVIDALFPEGTPSQVPVIGVTGTNGICILNADDPRTRAMMNYAGGVPCLFSMGSAKTDDLLEHIARNGRAITREVISNKMHIVLYIERKRIPIIATDDIPATYSGAAAFNIENALAATAITSALGIDAHIIRTALASFSSSFEQNPGRFNIYDGHGFRVIMDYAHNPAALRAFYAMIRQMRPNYLRVIGNISVPGDRRDEDIREAGRIACSELDIAVFSEKPDLRGRSPGEIHTLLKEGADSITCAKERIICVSQETEAIETCLSLAQPGDLVIVIASYPDECWKQIMQFKPQFAQRCEKGILTEQVVYA